MSDEKHEEIRRLSSTLTEKKSEGFSAATLLFDCEGTQDHEHLGRNCQHIFSGTSLRPICIFSSH